MPWALSNTDALGIGSAVSLVQEDVDAHMDNDDDDEGPGGIDDAPDW